MEESVFPVPAVAGQLRRMVEARIHNDAVDTQDEVRAWQDGIIHTLATPSYALINPVTGKLIDKHEGPETNPEVFAKWLERAHERWKAGR
jgi:hypothetical protein